jgi:hypothetical protein
MLFYSCLTHISQSAGPDVNGCLDFPAFQRFVRQLKARPDIEKLYLQLSYSSGGIFNFNVFQDFMTRVQKVLSHSVC